MLIGFNTSASVRDDGAKHTRAVPVAVFYHQSNATTLIKRNTKRFGYSSSFFHVFRDEFNDII